MNLKDKLKTISLGMGLGLTTMTGCTNNKQPEKEPVQDMLSAETNNDVDMYNNPVRLHKVEVTVYRNSSMKDEGYKQLVWGLDNNEQAALERTRAGQKTHLEEYDLPNGDSYMVETYDDGVLKANNSLIVIDRKIQVVGDRKNYALNLQRRADELQEQALQKKRERLEQIKAQERAGMRRSYPVKTEPEFVSDTIAAPKSSEPKDTLKQADLHKHDSLPIDTLRHIKGHERD